MKQFFVYWLWPNPGGWHYSDTNVQILLLASLGLIVLSFLVRLWRNKIAGSQARTLSASWPAGLLTYGILGAVLVACRVETIQFLSMRVLWPTLVLTFALFVIVQTLKFKRRHYVVLERKRVVDERDKYLPKRK